LLLFFKKKTFLTSCESRAICDKMQAKLYDTIESRAAGRVAGNHRKHNIHSAGIWRCSVLLAAVENPRAA